MTAPPPLYVVPTEPGVSLLKDADPDAVELQPTVIDAVPVDQPAPPGDGWMAERRARMDSAPAVIPPWLRKRDQFTEATSFVVRYYGHVAAFHGVRAPVYTGRLWVRAPRGAGRLTLRWYRWVIDIEAKPVATMASAGTPDEWMRFAEKQTNRTNTRRKTSLFVGLPAAYLAYLGVRYMPIEGWAATVSAVASVLGAAGRQSDRPIVHRYVSVRLQRRLESGEIEEALEAIKVKGRVDFVNPIQTDGPGWLAEMDLPKGFLADDVLEKRAQLAGAMRRPLSTVWPETDRDAHPGRLKLWVAREDPAKAKRRIWPLMRDGQADLFKPIPFGFDPRGRPVALPLMYTNMLIGGVMGSGKTSAVLAIALAGALDPTAELWIYEMKGSGDLDGVQPVCHRYVSGDDDEHCKDALDALKALERELKRRKQIIADLPVSEVPNGRKVYPHLAKRRNLGLHPLLAIFDEVHTLFEHDVFGDEAASVAARLIRKARAYGIILVFTTQRPDANSIPKAISDNAILRFCLAVTGHIANDLVLGTSMYKRGIRATMFDPQKDAGTGWLARSALNAEIARAAFITQQESFDVGKRALALRIAAGTLTGQAAGEDITLVEDSTVVDHLRVVWPAGEQTMHSHVLVAALAAYKPDIYDAWMVTDRLLPDLPEREAAEIRTARSTALSNALRPYRVHTRQIHRRGDGGGGKGLRREDVFNAPEAPDED